MESGLRWGELTGLRVRDLDFATRLLTVTRAVVEVNPKFHPDNGRFLVKPYPKDKEYRRFKLSAQLTAGRGPAGPATGCSPGVGRRPRSCLAPGHLPDDMDGRPGSPAFGYIPRRHPGACRGREP